MQEDRATVDILDSGFSTTGDLLFLRLTSALPIANTFDRLLIENTINHQMYQSRASIDIRTFSSNKARRSPCRPLSSSSLYLSLCTTTARDSPFRSYALTALSHVPQHIVRPRLSTLSTRHSDLPRARLRIALPAISLVSD